MPFTIWNVGTVNGVFIEEPFQFGFFLFLQGFQQFKNNFYVLDIPLSSLDSPLMVLKKNWNLQLVCYKA